MRQNPSAGERPDRASGLLLVGLGVLTFGTGIYFSFFRPPMLPEDMQFTGTNPSSLPPELLLWLGIVFRTWGGFMVGFGILLVTLGAHWLSTSPEWIRLGVPLALLIGFGRFLASNVILRSHFLWFVGSLFVLAVASAWRIAAKHDP